MNGIRSISDNMARIAEQFGLAEIYVFGSRAAEIGARVRGGRQAIPNAQSDVDIGVRTAARRQLSAADRVELALALEAALEVQRVDLVLLPEASPFLAVDIIRGELLYCRDSDDQAEFELYVLRRAGDLAPFERERQDLVLKGGGR